MSETDKKPWQSKVLLLNGLAGLTLFIGLFWPPVHVVNDFVSANPQSIAIGWSVLNMILRTFKSNITLTD